MSKKKACKKCKAFVEGEKCQNCGGTEFSTNWQGRIGFLNTKKSMIAEKMDIKKEGEYTIKVR